METDLPGNCRGLDVLSGPAELLAIVKEMQQANLPVISLKDRDAAGADIELAEIDPLTFANFNRGTTDDSRRQMIGVLKGEVRLGVSHHRRF